MKTKFLVLLAAIAFAGVETCQAQFLNTLINSAKKTAEKKVEKEVDKKVEQGLDKIFNPKTGKYEQAPAQTADTWVCPACGHAGNTGNFCSDCGAKRPQPVQAGTWVCPACGHAGNTGKFCAECGAKNPAQAAADEMTQAMNQLDAALNEAAASLNEAAVQLNGLNMQVPQVEAAEGNSYAAQMAALQALGTLSQEELEHMIRLGMVLDKMSDEEAEAYMASHPDEMAFIVSLQIKMMNAQQNAGK